MTWSHDPDVRLTSGWRRTILFQNHRPVQSINQSQVSGNFEDQSQVLGNFEEGGSRSNPSLLFKVFFQGAVRLRVFTMCTSIGGTPPHLSSYFPWKGLAFVHFLYLWFTLVYLSCLYLVIWKLYFSVIFQSWHCSSGHLMKSRTY